MIEDIEERLLRLGLTDESLDIVDDEHIHLLVEVYEHTRSGPRIRLSRTNCASNFELDT